jgi:hypothetical protein
MAAVAVIDRPGGRGCRGGCGRADRRGGRGAVRRVSGAVAVGRAHAGAPVAMPCGPAALRGGVGRRARTVAVAVSSATRGERVERARGSAGRRGGLRNGSRRDRGDGGRCGAHMPGRVTARTTGAAAVVGAMRTGRGYAHGRPGAGRGRRLGRRRGVPRVRRTTLVRARRYGRQADDGRAVVVPGVRQRAGREQGPAERSGGQDGRDQRGAAGGGDEVGAQTSRNGGHGRISHPSAGGRET